MKKITFTRNDALGNRYKLIITKDKVRFSNLHGLPLSLFNITGSRQESKAMKEFFMDVMKTLGDVSPQGCRETLQDHLYLYTGYDDWRVLNYE